MMAPLWIILTISATVSGTWGPLPYDMAECQVRVKENSYELDRAFEKTPSLVIDGKVITRRDVKIGCFHLSDRPTLGAPDPESVARSFRAAELETPAWDICKIAFGSEVEDEDTCGRRSIGPITGFRSDGR